MDPVLCCIVSQDIKKARQFMEQVGVFLVGDQAVDFAEATVSESITDLEQWFVDVEAMHAAAGTVFFECIFCFCVAVLKNKNTSEKDRTQKINNLQTHWAQVVGNKYHVKEDMIFGPLAMMVNSYLKWLQWEADMLIWWRWYIYSRLILVILQWKREMALVGGDSLFNQTCNKSM